MFTVDDVRDGHGGYHDEESYCISVRADVTLSGSIGRCSSNGRESVTLARDDARELCQVIHQPILETDIFDSRRGRASTAKISKKPADL